MSLEVVGQRCVSEQEPELGLGLVASVDHSRIGIDFPASGERRLYARGTAVLKQVKFHVGETIRSRAGAPLLIETIEEDKGLTVYLGSGKRLREDEVSDLISLSSPLDRLLAGHADPGDLWALRQRALEARARFKASEFRGYLGGRIELIPHQFYILKELTSRQIPRVLLADEVGLGKTIEACLILQRLLLVGRIRRILVLVPETLTHQWFVELLRKFNLWFSIFDEQRCQACTESDPDGNPFLSSQLGLCSLSFLAENPLRRDQALAAGWDMVVVDEAHHLTWSIEHASAAPSADETNTSQSTEGEAHRPLATQSSHAAYGFVEQLARRTPGLILLTATPTQFGLEGHFARLRLLDPDRYSDLESFTRETQGYASVARIAEKIIEQKELTAKDKTALKSIFDKDPEGLSQRLESLAESKPGAREDLLRILVDQHGTGRVMFRNTRSTMSGFPKRKYCPEPVVIDNPTLLVRAERELRAEESGDASSIRYSFKDDPRIDWLATFLRKHAKAKVLLICKSQRKIAALEAALKEKINAKVGVFHEGLPLVQRDRNAAWFAEPEGAQLLLCSEIGSEGRNFQFAHHLVLFDLPLNPGLLEQRIGRLDRIGQTQTIQIHVPFLKGSCDECLAEWYQTGVDAFSSPMHGGNELHEKFGARLLELALAACHDQPKVFRGKMEALIEETASFRKELLLKMKQGRDRLLEFNSFNAESAERIVEGIRAVDADPFLRGFLFDLVDHFGVRITEHEGGDVFLDPSHAYIEGFPSIPKDGMLATFDRKRAASREDIRFLSADHPLVQDACDLLLDSQSGSCAFGFLKAETPGFYLEATFVLETVADSNLGLDQFLAPCPVRAFVDHQGRNQEALQSSPSFKETVTDASLHRFLETPAFKSSMVKKQLVSATEHAERSCATLKAAAKAKAEAVLGAELQRLIELARLNPQVRPGELELARNRLQSIPQAIEQARLRLDSLRMIVAGPMNFFEIGATSGPKRF